MTRIEYDNTVRDLFAPILGEAAVPQPGQGFAPDDEALGFDNNADILSVSPLLAEQYMNAAETLSEAAVARLDALLGCSVVIEGEDPCAQQFVTTFGERVFRRPLDGDDESSLLSLYSVVKTASDFETAIRAVIEAVLQSPAFLYRPEYGDPATANTDHVRLTDWELASRLSYFLWRSMPDEALFAQARALTLHTPEQVAVQARRLLADPRAEAVAVDFHTQWLGLHALENVTKDPDVFPEFDEDLRSSMLQETPFFVQQVLFHGDRRLETLLTAPYTFADERLARVYGQAGTAGGSLSRIDLDPSERSGFLTHPGLLAALAQPDQSSPIHRGKFVRERLLCQPLPDPPPGVVVQAPEVDPALPTRQRYAQHSADPSCASCHHLMDPIGFAFEHYDAIGRFRQTDGDRPVDATGEISSDSPELATDADGSFDGVVELGRTLAQSEDVHACVVRQWFRFAAGRAEESADVCALDAVQTAFVAGDGDVIELLVALTQTDAFFFRPPIDFGGAP